MHNRRFTNVPLVGSHLKNKMFTRVQCCLEMRRKAGKSKLFLAVARQLSTSRDLYIQEIKIVYT